MNTRLSKLAVLLVEDDPDYAALVNQWLRGPDEERKTILHWTDSLSAALNRLAQGGIDVVLLDLGLPDSQGMETFLAVSSRCAGIPMIVLSAGDSESLALQTIRHGAEDYLVKGDCSQETLIRALSYAFLRAQRHTDGGTPGRSLSKIVTVIGAKGGTGTTTVACTLAAELREQLNTGVLLADMDLESGLVGFLTGVESRYSVLDAAQKLDRLDQTFWESMITDVAGLHVVQSPGPAGLSEIDSSSLAGVVTFAKALYPWVVLDLGRLRLRNLRLLEESTDTLLVTTNSISSLHEAKRTIEALRSYGFDPEKLRVVVNHADEAASPLGTGDLAKLFGVPVYARLPWERNELRNALVEKRLPAESSDFRGNVRNMARRLAGLEELKPRKSFPDLLSFVTRTKRSNEAPLSKQ